MNRTIETRAQEGRTMRVRKSQIVKGNFLFRYFQSFRAVIYVIAERRRGKFRLNAQSQRVSKKRSQRFQMG